MPNYPAAVAVALGEGLFVVLALRLAFAARQRADGLAPVLFAAAALGVGGLGLRVARYLGDGSTSVPEAVIDAAVHLAAWGGAAWALLRWPGPRAAGAPTAIAVLAGLALLSTLLVSRSPLPNGRVLHLAAALHGAGAVAFAAAAGAAARARGMPAAVWIAPFVAAQVHVLVVLYRALANVSSPTVAALPNTRLGIALGLAAIMLAVAPCVLALARVPLPREDAIARTTRRFLPVGDLAGLGLGGERKER